MPEPLTDAEVAGMATRHDRSYHRVTDDTDEELCWTCGQSVVCDAARLLADRAQRDARWVEIMAEEVAETEQLMAALGVTDAVASGQPCQEAMLAEVARLQQERDEARRQADVRIVLDPGPHRHQFTWSGNAAAGEQVPLGATCACGVTYQQAAQQRDAPAEAEARAARLVEAAQQVVDESSADRPPSLGAIERLRAALTPPGQGQCGTRGCTLSTHSDTPHSWELRSSQDATSQAGEWGNR